MRIWRLSPCFVTGRSVTTITKNARFILFFFVAKAIVITENTWWWWPEGQTVAVVNRNGRSKYVFTIKVIWCSSSCSMWPRTTTTDTLWFAVMCVWWFFFECNYCITYFSCIHGKVIAVFSVRVCVGTTGKRKRSLWLYFCWCSTIMGIRFESVPYHRKFYLCSCQRSKQWEKAHNYKRSTGITTRPIAIQYLHKWPCNL